MKKFLFLLILLCIEKALEAQYVYTIKADSVKITNSCDTAELIIENHTQTVPGFLFNKGGGRTEFRKVLQKLNDTSYLVGPDSLKIPNAWLQGGNRFGSTGILGTLDTNHLDFYTNNLRRGRFTNTGNLLIGTTTDNGYKLQVYGNSYFNGVQQITGTASGASQFAFSTFNPTISTTGSDWSYFYGERFYPTINFTGNNQQAYAVSISPTFNLNGYQQHQDAISAALHVSSSLGGIRIDQNASASGTTGQPLFIYQGGSANKELIKNYRNSNLTTLPFIWNFDNRPTGNRSSVIPALRSSISSGTVEAGGGISFTLDRYYSETEASIEMKYETTPIYDTPSTINTSIAFKTRSTGSSVTPLYLNGSKVGIGTVTPSAQLHSTGTVRFSGLTNDNSQTRILVSDVNGNLYYRDASSLAMNEVINSDLAVSGTVSAQKIKITQTGAWPDYVFSKQYHLPMLSEVEQYIKQNNHLPGIPSAAEVEKKGIDVADNQAALLKKIEELTLYVIEQEKKWQKQNEEIAELKKQNHELESLKQQMAELRILLKNKN